MQGKNLEYIRLRYEVSIYSEVLVRQLIDGELLNFPMI